MIHRGFTNLRAAAASADLVVICTPVDTVPKIVFDIDSAAHRKVLVTDVGSTKSEITKVIGRRKLKNAHFVGSHPLAGSHLTGVEHAKSDLFHKAIVFVTPGKNLSRQVIGEISGFWKKLDAVVKITSPEKHDQIVSKVSHLPHAIAASLVQTVTNGVAPYAATGFLDSTRIAQGDPRLWAPIFLSNRKNLLKDLNVFERNLKKLEALLKRLQARELAAFLKKASVRRSKCCSHNS